jgi:thioredoxin reductase (NADPH)
MDEVLDCAVIGGGPAGLTAAIYLGRSRRSFVVFDAGDSRARWIPTSHNYPGFPEGITGEQLLARLRAQADRYHTRVVASEVTALARDEDGLFHLTTAQGVTRARRVLLASGVTDNEPEVEDVFHAVKRGLVRICPICDGYESSGLSIGVIGNCQHAAPEALFLRTYSNRITVLATGGTRAEDRAKLIAAGIGLMEVPLDGVELEGEHVVCRSTDGAQHRFDIVYAALGVTARSGLAHQVGAELGDDDRLVVDDHMHTSVDGLYAAGDIVRGLNQIAVATSEAAISAIAIHNSLPHAFA